MTEKRFELAYEKGNWWAVRDGDITLWKEEVVYLLNEQHEGLQRFKTVLREFINNERTAMGKSVLLQLAEALEVES